jgi:hypothetical protein
MPNTHLRSVLEAVDVLSRDEDLMREEKIILLNLMEYYIATRRQELEDGIPNGERDGD